MLEPAYDLVRCHLEATSIMLPRPLTSFVGRQTERANGVRLIESAAIVTIVGPPGVGKTRLAIEIVRGGGHFRDRSWFADLGTVTAPALVVSAVLAAIGVPAREEDGAEQIIRRIGTESALLVLDNCEHLVSAVGDLVLRLAADCPGLHVLTTSRIELGVSGERLLVLEPLQTPTSQGAETDATVLFVDRAEAAGAVIGTSETERLAVGRICAGLDGLPLAIELAAARTRTIGLQRLAAMVADPLAAAGKPPRVSLLPLRPLRDSIAWSYQLCLPTECTAWAMLAVFTGSFTLDAALAVLTDTGHPAPSVDLVEMLVRQSVVMTETDARGAVRYRMLDTIREYGRTRLIAEGLEERAVDAHGTWYAARGAELETEWVGPGQSERLRLVEQDLPNIRSAAATVLTRRRRLELLTGLVALPAAELWWTTGRLDEGLYWLRRGLEVCTAPDGLRFRLLVLGATFASAWRRLDEAEGYLIELRCLAAAGDDPYRVGAAAFAEGFAAAQRGDHEHAVAVLTDGIRVADADDQLIRMQLRSRQLLIFALNGLRQDAVAARVCAQVIVIADRLGEAYYRAYADQMLALYAWRRGSRTVAQAHARAALRSSLDFPERPENADLLLVSALIEQRWGDPLRAVALHSAAEATDRIGLRPATLDSADVIDAVRQLSAVPGAAAARTAGSSFTAREAIAFALGPRLSARRHGPAVPFTTRELEIANLIAMGMANKQIAARLELSPKTIEGHVTRLMAKLGVTSRVQIATWALRDTS